MVGDDQPLSDLEKQLEKCRGKYLELSSAVALLQSENSDLLMRVTALENWRRVRTEMEEEHGQH